MGIKLLELTAMNERAGQASNEPTQPPSVDRGLELNWAQWIGIPILAVIPVLAMAGVFGEHWESKDADGATARLRMQVEYPDRFRARLTKPITVSIENRSPATFDTVEVSFDTAFVDRFVGVSFIPEARDAYVVAVTDVHPGETRRVHLEFAADRVGRHAGRVVARAGGDSAVIALHTVVFP